MCELLEEVFDDPLIVVAPAQNVVKGRKAMRLASFSLVVELFGLELVAADHTPVVTRRVHRETGRERAIHTNDHGILPGAAVPREVIALHEIDHLPEAGV